MPLYGMNKRRRLLTIPVLALPGFSKTFIIETNALGFRLGAMLMQEDRPIAYFSQKLSERAREKSLTIQRWCYLFKGGELMAVVLSI